MALKELIVISLERLADFLAECRNVFATAEQGSKADTAVQPADIADFITKTVDDLANYYLKSETYTKDEVAALIGAIQQFHYEVYPTLADVTDPAANVLYLIGPTGTGSDLYEEYVYPNNTTGWVKIGDTSIDLSGYVTTTNLNTILENYVTVTDLETVLSNYTNTSDLNLLLAAKQDVITDLDAIRTGSAAGITAVQPEALEAKQDILVSGENIKTVNGSSLLGSGNVYIPTAKNYAQNNEESSDYIQNRPGGFEYSLYAEDDIIYDGSFTRHSAQDSYYEGISEAFAEDESRGGKELLGMANHGYQIPCTYDVFGSEGIETHNGVIRYDDGLDDVVLFAAEGDTGVEAVSITITPANIPGGTLETGTYRFPVQFPSKYIPHDSTKQDVLTDVQLAALNSNITAELTSKLQGLPSKPVDTAAQVLTDVEKLQARTNIGANPVTSWNNPPLDTNIPAEKLVYDSMFVKGVISQTQTWASDYGSYTLSDVVRGDIPRSFIDMWNSRVIEFGTFNETTGYFELNGLTDISYAEARDIVRMYEKGMAQNAWAPTQGALDKYYTARTGIRTNPPQSESPYFSWNTHIEVSAFQYPNEYRFFNALTSYGCYRLRRMKDKYKINNALVLNLFYALEECYFSLTNDFTATASKYLSLASVVYMVENARNTGAVTYTLHSAAYARCQADTTEYEYSGQTYTGILALASAKNITIASE